ncbi:MAG: aspartate aminotransferase family protein [Candidatus Heimdallarchaeota archaeon]
MKFEELNYDEAPQIRTELPGPKAIALLSKQKKIEGDAISYPRGIPLVLEEGRGATVQDIDGNIFIDFFAGAGVLALGHCNPQIMDAVKTQQQKLTHTLDFPTKIRLKLIELLRSLMPGQLKDTVRIQFGGPTGSDAVEMAIKLAKYYTQRHGLISFEGAYHGMTAGASSLTSGKYWKEKYIPMLPEVHFVPYAYCYRCAFDRTPNDCGLECASYYEHVLEDPHSGVVLPAGTIVEPIQGEGGSIIPPDSFIPSIRNTSEDYHVPIIFDEIQAGFYRTGELFSFQHYDAIPDIITMSKALGGGFPLSAIAFKEELNIWRKGAHIGTFRGNVTAMAAGVASIEFMLENNIGNYAKSIGALIKKRLSKLEETSSIVGDVRGKGLMLGLEMVEDKETKKPSSKLARTLRTECFRRGLLIEIGGHYDNVARFLPPLILTDELARIATDIIIESVESIEKVKKQ